MKSFKVGQSYIYHCWFTGGEQRMTVVDRTKDAITFEVNAHELDGNHISKENYNVDIDEEGNESVLIYSYHERENRIYAEEVVI